MDTYFLPYEALQQLLDMLNRSYTCLGPQVRDDLILYDRLDLQEQLPWGIKQRQSPGYHRLTHTDEKVAFHWANGAQAIKPRLFRPKETLWRVERTGDGQLHVEQTSPHTKPLALFGVRPCDVQAMLVQDNVFIQDGFTEIHYQKQRDQLFLIVVNCIISTQTCFCVSAGGSPEANDHADMILTELPGEGFTVLFYSADAQTLAQDLNLKTASKAQCTHQRQLIQQAISQQSKTIPQKNLPQRLMANLDHERWDDIAQRCLSCGNCTQVCPTCFCHRQADEPSLDLTKSEHIRLWDSCFSQEHSYIHGLQVRDDTRKRYRQWLTHKFATWHEQFDTSGCVGCGRCMTWCPVGIDVTEELNIICDDEILP